MKNKNFFPLNLKLRKLETLFSFVSVINIHTYSNASSLHILSVLVFHQTIKIIAKQFSSTIKHGCRRGEEGGGWQKLLSAESSISYAKKIYLLLFFLNTSLKFPGILVFTTGFCFCVHSTILTGNSEFQFCFKRQHSFP